MNDFFIVATPIGNYDDITYRAVKILREVDFIVCEHEKEYKRLFSYLELPVKEFIVYTHKKYKEAIELTLEAINNGETGALISDCGTPLFEDPGSSLIEKLFSLNINVIPIPGANSIATALSVSPFVIKDFYFAGFLPQKTDIREKQIAKILKRNETIIFMETPYRLLQILQSLDKILNKNDKIYLPFNLTLTDEQLIYDTPANIIKKFNEQKIDKGEFLIIIPHKKGGIK